MSTHVLTARDRMERVIFVAAGIGGVVFTSLLAPGHSGFLAQRDQLQPWFWAATLIFATVIPVLLIGVARVSLAGARWLARVAIIGFLACQVLWVPAMTVPMLAHDANPWLQGINALPATLAAVAWRSRWSWAVALSQGPLVAIVQIKSGSGLVIPAVLDGIGAVLFCSILTGIAVAVLHAADEQDEAASRAREQAALDARRRTEERELGRIDAIVHNDIMSVLLTASRADAPPTLTDQAALALGSISTITDADQNAPTEYTASEVTALLRATLRDMGSDAEFTYELHGDSHVPGDAVAALAEALGEAIRNAAHHAGSNATVRVTLVIEPDAVTLDIRDDGQGFSVRNVAATRLGIRVSIVERMASVPGGSGAVTARPGRGTHVALGWRRP